MDIAEFIYTPWPTSYWVILRDQEFKMSLVKSLYHGLYFRLLLHFYIKKNFLAKKKDKLRAFPERSIKRKIAQTIKT